jgi:hypothetical protein
LADLFRSGPKGTQTPVRMRIEGLTIAQTIARIRMSKGIAGD